MNFQFAAIYLPMGRCHKNFFSHYQKFNYKRFSKEDIYLAHIEPPITPPEPLSDPRAAIVFQPTARASAACTKTNRRPVDRLELEVIFFFHPICAKWLSSLESDLWLNI